MARSTQQSFANVLSVNPYKETYFIGNSGFISKTSSPKYSKDQFAISYLNTKDFINAQIEVSKNIPQEDLYDAITNKVYDELALDQAVEYTLQYIEIFNSVNVLDEENRHFHVFIVNPADITKTFTSSIEKIKYIDIITPVPLLIKSLYEKEIIKSRAVHCFVYIQESDAFIAIYREKEFVYTKSIKFSLVDMHERFCELYGERINYSEFIKFISNEHLKESRSEYKHFILLLYKELFSNINDILTYAKRAFEIENFDHIYIGSQIQTVTKLHEILETVIEVRSSEFNFDYGLETNEPYVDQMHMLMQIHNSIPQERRYKCNFTLYTRPPNFIKRKSGQLILLTLISFLLAFSYPIIYWSLTYAQELQEELLKQEYKNVHVLKISREANIKSKYADKKKAETLLKEEKKKYKEKKDTLIQIHKVKVDYTMKAKLIALFAKDLNRFGVKINRVDYDQVGNQKFLSLKLLANRDRKITQLVEYLTDKYVEKFKFSLEEIKFDATKKKYVSELKVEIL